MTLAPLRRWLLLQYLLTVGLLLAAAGVSLYLVVAWAGEAELRSLLENEVQKLAAAVELTSKEPRIEGKKALQRCSSGRHQVAWQVLLPGGITLVRSRVSGSGTVHLPAVGGTQLAKEQLYVESTQFEDAPVLAARLRTVRHRQPEEAKPAPKIPLPNFGKKKGQTTWIEPKIPPRFPIMPPEMTFDIRVVVSRAALDEHLARLSWYLMGGYPVALGLAALTGVWLIRRSVHPVEQAFDRERRFAWAASHELRSPLTALRGEIDLALRRERSPAEYVAALRRIQPVVGRMTSLVEGLLVLARARSGQLLLGVGETTVGAILGTTEDLLRVLPDQERVQVILNVTPDARLLGDRLLLATGLRNLVENSLRHAPPSTPVEITINSVGDHRLEFTVIDYGPGLPETLLKKGLAGTTDPEPTSQGGTGLGLAIVRAIVEAHNGRLTLTNLPEGGCRAAITLPALSTLTEAGTMNRRAVDARPLPELEPQLHAD